MVISNFIPYVLYENAEENIYECILVGKRQII